MTDGLNHGPTKMYLLFCDLKTVGMVYGVLPKEQKKRKKRGIQNGKLEKNQLIFLFCYGITSVDLTML